MVQFTFCRFHFVIIADWLGDHLSSTSNTYQFYLFYNYTLAERFSTFVGPITWGLITLLLLHTGSLRYRIALMAMVLFILMGLLIVKSIPSAARKKVL